ncbi:hypothetical protein [uncultured Sanguibacteroides sp.]|uniref:hypothetical protein n=1 Tax=uncultured Sanguibacteroides sp. TaxID=1635151 RepID=UPI0025F90A1B|nr:hypothetical protein [uncultured Sanguibacteroides sp.]
MKKIGTLLFLTCSVIVLSLWLAACSDDDKNERKDLLQGSWNIDQATAIATPIENATMTKEQLEAVFNNYTFFGQGSEITFIDDTVKLVATFGDVELPMKLPYTFEKDTLTITAAASPTVTFEIKGAVDFYTSHFEFNLTDKSYMSILQFVVQLTQEPNLQNALTQTKQAHASYNLVKK